MHIHMIYPLIPQVLLNKWVRDYFGDCADEIHWTRLSYGWGWSTVERQWCAHSGCMCACVLVRCFSEQVAVASDQTPGLRLLSDRWWSHCRAHLEGGGKRECERDTDFLLGLSRSLSFWCVSVRHGVGSWEVGCCFLWSLLLSYLILYLSGCNNVSRANTSIARDLQVKSKLHLVVMYWIIFSYKACRHTNTLAAL